MFVCMVAGFVASPAAQAQTVTFANAVNYAAGTAATWVAVGDFNNDSRPDLAVANSGTDNVTVRLNNGVGEFPTATTVTAGDGPQSVAVGDFNNNGNLDLAVANRTSGNNVSILLGNGSGGFSGPTNFAAGASPNSVAVGLFNADANLDLAVANNTANTVSILLGNGSGGFAAPTSVATGAGPYGVTVGNFNGGALDLAVANGGTNTVSILLGNGSGGFSNAAGSPVTMSTNPRQVAVGDYNNNGAQDITSANSGAASPNRTTTRLGNGAGGFAAAVACNTANSPFSVATGDFDADGNLDFAASGTNVRVCEGNGAGTFTLIGTSYTMGTNPRSLAVADFNGDGAPDIATANNGSPAASAISVRINITAIPGGLAIMIPTASVSLGAAAPGGQLTGTVGAVTVADNRGGAACRRDDYGGRGPSPPQGVRDLGRQRGIAVPLPCASPMAGVDLGEADAERPASPDSSFDVGLGAVGLGQWHHPVLVGHVCWVSLDGRHVDAVKRIGQIVHLFYAGWLYGGRGLLVSLVGWIGLRQIRPLVGRLAHVKASFLAASRGSGVAVGGPPGIVGRAAEVSLLLIKRLVAYWSYPQRRRRPRPDMDRE
jgi:hypothetical protein